MENLPLETHPARMENLPLETHPARMGNLHVGTQRARLENLACALPRPTFDTVDDASLLRELKSLVGRSNALTAHVLAHLAEVDARGAYREVACASLHKYCIYELRMSEDEA